MTGARALRGGCHCGQVTVSFSTALGSAELRPRACDCAFCTKHGARWLSDPRGRLDLLAAPGALREYRHGSRTARFLLCGTCGVLVAVVLDEATLVGSANARCLDAAPTFGDEIPVSPQKLTREEKIARWRGGWTPTAIREETVPASPGEAVA